MTYLNQGETPTNSTPYFGKSAKLSDIMNGEAHDSDNRPISTYFGELTFGLGQMRDRLPRDAFQELTKTLDQGKTLSKETADAIAPVIKEWAVSKGATHFCHWFQPMTGLTAEKHDSFIDIQHYNHSELKVLERFTGSQLVQGEPDASSFPSGGMRTTFEARGYTAWDPTSPIFIVEGPSSKTICIPSVFFGYHGEALDNKTPLLRSVQSLSSEACQFLKLLGDVDVKNVTSTLGCEQEYFLVDREVAAKRPDIVSCGRTLFGAVSIRGQKLEDHYFGSIPTRAKAFMEDLERELYRLGIPIKTRHNEVAPSQFEMAPIFENASIAADHNILAMETMRRVAARHNLWCLLHEKPFSDVNGSGKHCNWSVSNDKGENLLEPGRTPHQNLRFLAFVAVVVRAVHEHSDLLASAILTPGNEHRLGGNEAPPTIVSVFLGDLLEKIFEDFVNDAKASSNDVAGINLGIGHLPEIKRDATDRNRTSPFAFTGNKFEFRAVGSSANVAVPVSILNGAMADALAKSSVRLKELLEEKSERDEAVRALIRETVSNHGAVLFSGDNYSDEWRAEAKKRGLPLLSSCAESFQVLADEAATKFLVDTNIFSRAELVSRYHINVERYATTILIELETMAEMIAETVIPALEHQLALSHSVGSVLKNKSVSALYGKRLDGLEQILSRVLECSNTLKEATAKAHDTEKEFDKVLVLRDEGLAAAENLRLAANEAELAVAENFWTLPKYRDLLFHHSMND